MPRNPKRGYVSSVRHCAACGVSGRAKKLVRTYPIPLACRIELPFRSIVNTRLCSTCYMAHYHRTKGKVQNGAMALLVEASLHRVPLPESSSEPSTRTLLIRETPLQDLRFRGDVYSLLEKAHVRFLQHLQAVWRKVSHELQTSRVEQPDRLPAKTSSTHAELSLKPMVQILLYLVHRAPPAIRLNPYADGLTDIGSGYGWVLVLAYAGFGIENVTGIELVAERALLSQSHLGRVLEPFGLDLTTGYRSVEDWPLNETYHLDSACRTRAETKCEATVLDPRETRVTLLPPCLRIFAGDITHHAEGKTEAWDRVCAASHLLLFDLRFTHESIEQVARMLSRPPPAARWRLMMSMRNEVDWTSAGLVGWAPLGRMPGLGFKGNGQAPSVFFYVRQEFMQQLSLVDISEPEPYLPSKTLRLLLDNFQKTR